MKKILLILTALTACSEIPAGAYFNRGEPESLLDASTEVISVPVGSKAALAKLSNAVAQDPPTRAELTCMPGDKLCAEAKKMFDARGIPASFAAGDGSVTLVYERVIARDCENRYIDNSINPYNLHPPTFGCSVAGNMVQQVSDKRQFVSPSLMDLQDGEKAVQSYGKYMREDQPEPKRSEWLIENIKFGGSSGR